MKALMSSDIAIFLNADLRGESREIRKPADLDECGEGDLVWLKKATRERLSILAQRRPALAICDAATASEVSGVNTLVCPNPRLAFIKVLNEFFVRRPESRIHPSADIDPKAKVGNDVSIGGFSIIGPEVKIGNHCRIASGVRIQGDVTLGERCAVKPNSVIGEYGFSFEYDEDGTPLHFPHLGRIVLEDDVWIGSCTTIELAALGTTRLGKGTKVDDLVQIGHNVTVGKNTLIMANVVLCGKAVIGDRCWIAPNSVVKENVRVGSGATVGLGAVVTKDVEDRIVVAGVPARKFPQRTGTYLDTKLSLLKDKYGQDSSQYLGLSRQYHYDATETLQLEERNTKHYEAAVSPVVDGEGLPGLERLYERTLVIEITFACVAHCRYCLRAEYSKLRMTPEQLVNIARYCGNAQNRSTLNELLITGGDPLLAPRRVAALLDALIEYAPNIHIIRLATRLPGQDPGKIDDEVLALFKNRPSLRFELATQINHPIEFFPEMVEVFRRVRDLGVKIYSQNVLLKGVNDDLSTLSELYDKMRQHDIEAHYLFHPVPIRGTHHLRPTIDESLELARALTSSGHISGRAKPMFAAMTDIGKVVFYHGTILDREDGSVLLQSSYKLDDRMRWNPTWELPESAHVDASGSLRVWYLDGEESEPSEETQTAKPWGNGVLASPGRVDARLVKRPR